MKAAMSTFKKEAIQLVVSTTVLEALEASRPAITAMIYVIIKNEDKTEGFTPYIMSVIAM
jgi:RecG-like helicase